METSNKPARVVVLGLAAGLSVILAGSASAFQTCDCEDGCIVVEGRFPNTTARMNAPVPDGERWRCIVPGEEESRRASGIVEALSPAEIRAQCEYPDVSPTDIQWSVMYLKYNRCVERVKAQRAAAQRQARDAQRRMDEAAQSEVEAAVPQEAAPPGEEEAPSPGGSAAGLRQAARGGDPEAQYKLGDLYYYGRGGVEQDYGEAAKWYRKAAEQGLPQAQSDLGLLYEMGKGVPKDYEIAVKWYRKAAKQGNAKARYNLGDMYENGKGVGEDRDEAIRLYRLAAEQGDEAARKALRRLASQ